LRLALAAALCLAAGCTGPGTIKGYPGATRGSGELGKIVTILREGEFSSTDNRITAVDGVGYDKGSYTAEVLPGMRRIGIHSLLRTRMQPREQHCTFELNVEPGCTYRPAIPDYPRSAYDLKPAADWKLTRAMTVVAECADTSYAVNVPIDCTARP
jgi:hypothetical protein